MIHRRATILVVDDAVTNRQLLTAVLSLDGYQVQVASNGPHALEVIQTHPPDLILLDVMMPDMTGYEVCEQLKNNAVTQHIPIIFISALDKTKDKVNAFSAGGVDYITKPFHPDEVLARVKTHLTIRYLQDQLQNTNETLAQKVEELEIKNAELDAFGHTVAHDLKSSVNMLVGYAEFLSDEGHPPTPDELQSAVRQMTRHALRINDITESLLLLATTHKQDINLEPVHMGEVLTHVHYRLHQEIQAQEATLTIPESWPLVWGYAPWVEEVWLNYVSNGLKYGGSRPQLHLGFTPLQDENQVRFWIRDNGPGLTPNEAQRLFTPFTRIHTERAGGHGLGLTIVQRIITRLGGQVGVESAPGAGSTFFFTLPLLKP